MNLRKRKMNEDQREFPLLFYAFVYYINNSYYPYYFEL